MTAVLDPATRALVRIALGVPGASEARLAEWLEEAGRAVTPALWIDEMLVSSLLYVGYPRALVALGVWRRVAPEPAAGAEPSDYARWPEWRARGEATCRAVYGKHYEQLRLNVRALHPALEQWMIVDGYGRTLGRPGLDLRRRELCSVALLVSQQVPRQLLAHLRGALHAGAAPEEVDEVLDLAAEAGVFPDVLALARDLWRELRDTLQHD